MGERLLRPLIDITYIHEQMSELVCEAEATSIVGNGRAHHDDWGGLVRPTRQTVEQVVIAPASTTTRPPSSMAAVTLSIGWAPSLQCSRSDTAASSASSNRRTFVGRGSSSVSLGSRARRSFDSPPLGAGAYDQRVLRVSFDVTKTGRSNAGYSLIQF